MIKCIDASIRQVANMTNKLFKESPNAAKDAFFKGVISSDSPKITPQIVKDTFDMGNCYNKAGKLTTKGKKEMVGILKTLGLKASATIEDLYKNLYK